MRRRPALAARYQGLAVPALASRGDSTWCGCCLRGPRSTAWIIWGRYTCTVGVRAWLAELRTGHLALSTPCSEWTVRQLLAHVIGGDYAYIDLLVQHPICRMILLCGCFRRSTVLLRFCASACRCCVGPPRIVVSAGQPSAWGAVSPRRYH